VPAALPLPLAWRGPGNGRTLTADAASRVRFRIGHRTAECRGVTGELTWGRAGAPAELQLRIDLARLVDLDAGAVRGELWRLLGVQNGDVIDYRARAVAVETYDVAGVSRITWLGSLQLGTRVRQQVMQTFLATLLPPAARMQGVGTVDGRDFGLPERYSFGVLPQASEVTVALDLAWRQP
jgi:hypothetical protein